MEQRQTIALTSAFAFVLLFACTYNAALTYYGGDSSLTAQRLYSAMFALFVACGVNADRRKRTVGSCYEYGAFVFFLWPFILPVYLYKTRGWYGVVKALGVIALFFVPWCTSWFVYWWLIAPGA